MAFNLNSNTILNAISLKHFKTHVQYQNITHTQTHFFFNHTAEPKKHKTFTIKPIRLINIPSFKAESTQTQFSHSKSKYTNTNKQKPIEHQQKRNQKKKRNKINSLTTEINQTFEYHAKLSELATSFSHPENAETCFFYKKFCNV